MYNLSYMCMKDYALPKNIRLYIKCKFSTPFHSVSIFSPCNHHQFTFQAYFPFSLGKTQNFICLLDFLRLKICK